MKKRLLALIATPVLAITLSSWGWMGHSIISNEIQLSFNEEMTMFNSWADYIQEHASDPDKRKYEKNYYDDYYDSFPDEGPKHYIDIDSYSGFVENGRIPHTLDSCYLEYGSGFVADNGFLPWATLASYDSIVACLKRNDEAKAMYHAADLGHYVADGHMPMHLTKNYDGQLSGNKGIHSRYESDMIGKYSNEIDYEGMPVEKVDNILDYIFTYIYENYEYMDSILLADDYAYELTSSKSSPAYYETLWEKTKNLTIVEFKNGSHAIAELLYNAMLEANGTVDDDDDDDIADNIRYETNPSNSFSLKVYPNPLCNNASIKFNTSSTEALSVSIHDMSGRLTEQLGNNNFQSGENSIYWNTTAYNPGSYVVIVKNDKFIEANKILIYR